MPPLTTAVDVAVLLTTLPATYEAMAPGEPADKSVPSAAISPATISNLAAETEPVVLQMPKPEIADDTTSAYAPVSPGSPPVESVSAQVLATPEADAGLNGGGTEEAAPKSEDIRAHTVEAPPPSSPPTTAIDAPSNTPIPADDAATAPDICGLAAPTPPAATPESTISRDAEAVKSAADDNTAEALWQPMVGAAVCGNNVEQSSETVTVVKCAGASQELAELAVDSTQPASTVATHKIAEGHTEISSMQVIETIDDSSPLTSPKTEGATTQTAAHMEIVFETTETKDTIDMIEAGNFPLAAKYPQSASTASVASSSSARLGSRYVAKKPTLSAGRLLICHVMM
ncbi:hypothetical protein CYMTET_27411 [Cymbomonas tetramitiformis]|uniref:Uncharacterized protein n=1 Tax=Cymbomonas tetramitiformis TaxID=36881 RepID=A0AAE0KWY1_9CHLO|nr:hypothetical protein CYMTET_27411 [Cymbomonas tetramitiformis]